MIAHPAAKEDRESPSPETPDSVLELRDISKCFPSRRGQIDALEDVSLRLDAGRIGGLVGPDGAGKTTLLRLAAGLLFPDRGRILVLGNRISRRASPAREVLGYMPQHFGLYEDLTVRENLDLYADLRGQPPDQRQQRYDELMRMTGLEPFTRRLAGQLSGGMKQKLGLACVLVRSPRLLLLDEPTAGVDPVSRRELWAIIDRLVEEQTSVLLSTGYLDEASHCDEVFVFHSGVLLRHGTPDELRRTVQGHTYRVTASSYAPRDLQAVLTHRPGILDAAVEGGGVRLVAQREASFDPSEALSDVEGAEFEAVDPRFEDAFVTFLKERENAKREEDRGADTVSSPPSANSDQDAGAPSRRFRDGDQAGPVIEVEGLKRRFGDFEAVKGLDFTVTPGEVFGLLGANGAGKSTTFRMLCGLLPPTAGNLQVAGVDMRKSPTRARARIGYMSQTFSLYGNLSVIENLRFFSSAYGLGGRRRRDRIAWALSEFQLQPWRNQPSEMLPLGYKQRLALAAALVHQPQVLFLDEPTSGVDPLARREFWRRISELAAQGVTVMVTTHFMEEADYCDRLAIMMTGEILSLGSPAEIKREAQTKDNRETTIEDAFIQLIESREQSGNGKDEP